MCIITDAMEYSTIHLSNAYLITYRSKVKKKLYKISLKIMDDNLFKNIGHFEPPIMIE